MKDKRVTIYDVAERLNVSASTVTRALNGRKGVGEEMRGRILACAEELGYRANLVAKSLQRSRMRIGVIVNDRVHTFNSAVIEGARSAAAALVDYNVEGEFELIPCVDLNNRIREIMRRMMRDRFDGIIFVANDTFDCNDILDEVTRSGIAVGSVILSSPNPNIAFSVSPDNFRAGCMAADLFSISGLPKGAQVLTTLGFTTLQNHTQSLEGFHHQNMRYGYRVHTLYHYDDPETAYRLVKSLLIENPTIRGIYSSTAMTDPICRVLNDLNRRDIKVVRTEITENTRRYFEQGILMATIYQNPFQQGKKAFETMYSYLESGNAAEVRDIKIDSTIVVPGNLEFYERRYLKEE
ncbi:MAG: LacI family DNA-binding transcriptional regulator [Clostridia bacterium]|nr:LacI family DNA-binding transcriptional regulator [Clostridia bacterium]